MEKSEGLLKSEKSKELLKSEEIINQDFGNIKKYKLTTPVKVGDKEYIELSLDFESLKAKDMENISKLPGCNSGDSNMNEFSKTYLMHVVCRAAGITINEFREFGFADGTALTMMAQVFLMGAVSKIIPQ
jgi:hypothetical protein